MVFEELMRVRPAVLQCQVAVERKPGLNRPQLHHFGQYRRWVCRPRHGRHLDGIDPGGAGNVCDLARNPILNAWRPRPIARYQHVGRNQRARFSRQDLPHALNHRSQGHDGAHADRDAEKEERQPLPRESGFPKSGEKDESHATRLYRRAEKCAHRPSPQCRDRA